MIQMPSKTQLPLLRAVPLLRMAKHGTRTRHHQSRYALRELMQHPADFVAVAKTLIVVGQIRRGFDDAWKAANLTYSLSGKVDLMRVSHLVEARKLSVGSYARDVTAALCGCSWCN